MNEKDRLSVIRADRCCKNCGHPRSRHDAGRECRMKKRGSGGFVICNCETWINPLPKEDKGVRTRTHAH